MKIPNKVVSKAKNLIDQYGMNIEYVGQSKDKDVYMFRFPENSTTGFPVLYLYDKKEDTVEIVSGMESFDILDSLKECNDKSTT